MVSKLFKNNNCVKIVLSYRGLITIRGGNECIIVT